MAVRCMSLFTCCNQHLQRRNVLNYVRIFIVVLTCILGYTEETNGSSLRVPYLYITNFFLWGTAGIVTVLSAFVGWDSSVGIAARNGLDGSGIKSR
jgi:hypothetical protein